TEAIARGDFDGMISARAQAVAMLNTPVFIRWFWEMDGNKKAGFISNPASYVKAWRHIHDIFVAAGATNVAWVWCPNAAACNAGDKAAWFRQAGDWVAAHPAIAALVYFNADSTNNGISYNWRVDTAPQSFEGFRYLFSGPAPVPPTDPVPSAAPDPAAPEPL